MSRPTDDEIRAAFQLRASGSPHGGLLERIREGTQSMPRRPAMVVNPGRWSHRPLAARLAAIAAVAAALVLAPFADAGSSPLQQGDPPSGQPNSAARPSAEFAMEVDADDNEGDAEDADDEAEDADDEVEDADDAAEDNEVDHEPGSVGSTDR